MWSASDQDSLEFELLAPAYTASGLASLGKEGWGTLSRIWQVLSTSFWVPCQGSPSRFPWDTSPRAYRGEPFLFRAEYSLVGLFSNSRRSRLGKSSSLSPVLSSSHDGEIPWSGWLGRFPPVRVSQCASLPCLASESLDSVADTTYELFPLLDGAAACFGARRVFTVTSCPGRANSLRPLP